MKRFDITFNIYNVPPPSCPSWRTVLDPLTSCLDRIKCAESVKVSSFCYRYASDSEQQPGHVTSVARNTANVSLNAQPLETKLS